jgi:hypothetical protein
LKHSVQNDERREPQIKQDDRNGRYPKGKGHRDVQGDQNQKNQTTE